MRLESFKDKKVIRRKMILISLGVITIIGVSLLLYKTFASFKSEVTFPMMSGKVNYYGNADLIFAFYKGDEKLDEMPQKGNSENLVFDHGTCDNGATIEWNENEWAPLVKGLNQTKTTCSLYFKEIKLGILREISNSNIQGMWIYGSKLTKIVIETKKQEKTAGEGQKVYGPFDEGIYGSEDAIQSYVVCETGDTNCIGYLQGDGGVKLISGSNLFSGFTKVTEIEGIENLNTRGVTKMNSMFSLMSSLQEIDLSHFNTSSVKDMSSMFYGMNNLQTLTFGDNFDTSSVTNMSHMFYECSKIQEIDLSHFDTSSVTDMSDMFGECWKLQTLNLSSFDTSLVTDMSSMFSNMLKLQTLTFGDNFDTSSVKDMSSMFEYCSQLQELDLSHFDTHSVTDMNHMFSNMSNLQTLTFGDNFDTSSVKDMSSMFFYSSQLQELDLSHFDTSNVTNMSYMFYYTSKLTKITYGPNFIHNVDAKTSSMFYNCPANKPDPSVLPSWEGVTF